MHVLDRHQLACDPANVDQNVSTSQGLRCVGRSHGRDPFVREHVDQLASQLCCFRPRDHVDVRSLAFGKRVVGTMCQLTHLGRCSPPDSSWAPPGRTTRSHLELSLPFTTRSLAKTTCCSSPLAFTFFFAPVTMRRVAHRL